MGVSASSTIALYPTEFVGIYLCLFDVTYLKFTSVIIFNGFRLVRIHSTTDSTYISTSKCEVSAVYQPLSAFFVKPCDCLLSSVNCVLDNS